MYALSPDFKKTLTKRELYLHGQRYPSTEVGIRLSRLVRQATGHDLFLYSEGKTNIQNDTREFIVDGVSIGTIAEEEIERWEDATGDKAVLYAEGWYQAFITHDETGIFSNPPA